MIGQHVIEKVKSAAYGVSLLGPAGLDWLLGPRCALCGLRVYPKDAPAHTLDHAGDDR